MSDEVTRRNILAIKAHSEETRKELRKMQTENKELHNLVETLNGKLGVLEKQLRIIQVRIFSGGATS